MVIWNWKSDTGFCIFVSENREYLGVHVSSIFCRYILYIIQTFDDLVHGIILLLCLQIELSGTSFSVSKHILLYAEEYLLMTKFV